MTEHLEYEPAQAPPGGAGNARSGSTPKTLITVHGLAAFLMLRPVVLDLVSAR